MGGCTYFSTPPLFFLSCWIHKEYTTTYKFEVLSLSFPIGSAIHEKMRRDSDGTCDLRAISCCLMLSLIIPSIKGLPVNQDQNKRYFFIYLRSSVRSLPAADRVAFTNHRCRTMRRRTCRNATVGISGLGYSRVLEPPAPARESHCRW